MKSMRQCSSYLFRSQLILEEIFHVLIFLLLIFFVLKINKIVLTKVYKFRSIRDLEVFLIRFNSIKDVLKEFNAEISISGVKIYTQGQRICLKYKGQSSCIFFPERVQGRLKNFLKIENGTFILK